MNIQNVTDTDLMARMLATFYEQEPGLDPLPSESIRAKAEKLMDASARERVFPLLLCHEGQYVGYVLLAPFFSNEYGGEVALLDEYLILPEWQGKGLGAGFLEKVKEWAVAKNLHALILEVTSANPRVVGLYERGGFSLLDRRLMVWRREG